MTEPPFDQPWHAQAFALTHHLADQGYIAWPDWTEAFAQQIANRPIETPDDYYAAWIDALESLLPDDTDTLAQLRAAWAEAYEATPHGQPVHLPSSL
ncbi:nitrile hydratase accessory protein [Palleronia abyssalis]|uniref:Nitrile hydratase beta subunit-like N-terminal domain-containing protein n=1 Tax=Palleronia abyssalis TaxID=1501240 RepID=A0A2R8BXB2_9RHOB|nr:nitrile hydratase accessory protein [Palleronia abyssalis]SPJ24798.1 hypothetical protein PAA8504_02637 [Palleronia abyssalis]